MVNVNHEGKAFAGVPYIAGLAHREREDVEDLVYFSDDGAEDEAVKLVEAALGEFEDGVGQTAAAMGRFMGEVDMLHAVACDCMRCILLVDPLILLWQAASRSFQDAEFDTVASTENPRYEPTVSRVRPDQHTQEPCPTASCLRPLCVPGIWRT